MLSPSLYAGFIVWTLLCANPGMLAVAYYLIRKNYSSSIADDDASGDDDFEGDGTNVRFDIA